MSSWTYRRPVWIHCAPQGTPEWKRSRMGRITASDFGTVLGVSRFSKPEELVPYLAGEKVKEMNDAMRHGHLYEPRVRKWYEETEGVRVEEFGLMVPEWDARIGGSLDGSIVGSGEELSETGMIEIKCPQKMYAPLKYRQKKYALPHSPTGECPSHIWTTHFAQMQGCMAITGKKWCDYVVYADEMYYKERIQFDQVYWEKLYASLTSFYEANRSVLETIRDDPPATH